MKQSLFILHSLNGNTNDSFKESVTKIAKQLGFDVFYPIFNTREQSSYDNFKKVMLSYKDYIDTNTVIVAHSISANYAVKFICEFNYHLKALIAVCSTIELSPTEMLRLDYKAQVKELSLPTVPEISYAKSNFDKIFLYYSDNDHHATQEMFGNFIKTLNAEPVFCKGYGHFTKRHNVTTLPNIKEILEQLKA